MLRSKYTMIRDTPSSLPKYQKFSSQIPIFVRNHQPRSQGPLLLGPHGQVAEDPGNEVEQPQPLLELKV